MVSIAQAGAWHLSNIFTLSKKVYPTYARQNKDRITARTIHSTALKNKKKKKKHMLKFFFFFFNFTSFFPSGWHTQHQRPTGQTRESWQYFWMYRQKWNSRGTKTDQRSPNKTKVEACGFGGSPSDQSAVLMGNVDLCSFLGGITTLTKQTCREGRQPVGVGLPVVMQSEREGSECATRLGGVGWLMRQWSLWGETLLLLLVGWLDATRWHFIRSL